MMRTNDFTEETKREERRAKVGKFLFAFLILLVGGYFVATNWERVDAGDITKEQFIKEPAFDGMVYTYQYDNPKSEYIYVIHYNVDFKLKKRSRSVKHEMGIHKEVQKHSDVMLETVLGSLMKQAYMTYGEYVLIDTMVFKPIQVLNGNDDWMQSAPQYNYEISEMNVLQLQEYKRTTQVVVGDDIRKRSDQQRLETFSELMQLQELQDTILSSILMQKVEADIHVFVARQQMEQTSLDHNDSLRLLTTTLIHQLEMKLLQQLIEDTDIPVLVTGINIDWAGEIEVLNKK